MSPVFNRDNLSRVEGEGEIAFMPLMGWKQHRIFRRTRLLTLPSRVWVPFKVTTLDGDSGIYKEKILRVRGRLVTATDSGAWIYQPGKKRVVYVPYTQTAIIKSGSSTGRTMYLAIMPVSAQIATWAALDAANADIYGSGHGLIGATVVFLTGCTDLMLWMDYMDKKSIVHCAVSTSMGLGRQVFITNGTQKEGGRSRALAWLKFCFQTVTRASFRGHTCEELP